MVELPVLEATGVGHQLVPIDGDEIGAVMIGLRRHGAVEDRVADVEESGAARAAQVLASGRREEVTADRLHVDVELADRLAGVDEIRHAGGAGQRTDLGGRD